MADLLKKLLPFQSEFSHRYACWANNHNGWSKIKKQNRKLAKTREKREVNKQIEDGLDEYINQKGIDVESEWYTNCTSGIPFESNEMRYGEKRNIVDENEDPWSALWRNNDE